MGVESRETKGLDEGGWEREIVSDPFFVRVLSKHQDSKINHVTSFSSESHLTSGRKVHAALSPSKRRTIIRVSRQLQQHSPTSHYEIPPQHNLPHPCSAPCQVLEYSIHLHCAPSLPANLTSQQHPPRRLRQHPAKVSPTYTTRHHDTTTTTSTAPV